jgi:hypothetical protein
MALVHGAALDSSTLQLTGGLGGASIPGAAAGSVPAGSSTPHDSGSSHTYHRDHTDAVPAQREQEAALQALRRGPPTALLAALGATAAQLQLTMQQQPLALPAPPYAAAAQQPATQPPTAPQQQPPSYDYTGFYAQAAIFPRWSSQGRAPLWPLQLKHASKPATGWGSWSASSPQVREWRQILTRPQAADTQVCRSSSSSCWLAPAAAAVSLQPRCLPGCSSCAAGLLRRCCSCSSQPWQHLIAGLRPLQPRGAAAAVWQRGVQQQHSQQGRAL